MIYLDYKKEFLHSWYVFIISVVAILFVFINHHIFINLILLIMVFFVYFKNGLKFSWFKKLLLYALFFALSLLAFNFLYSSPFVSKEKIIKNVIALFFVSLLSMSAGSVIDYTKIILYLMVLKKLKLFWGYPLLLAINSVSFLKDEFERVKINARLRNLPYKDRLFIFFPLLVFAIRHSERGALSLVTRGLNEEKSFYFTYDVSYDDKKRLKVFFFLFFCLATVNYFLHFFRWSYA